MKTLKLLLWIGLLCFGFSLNAQVNQNITFSVNDISTGQTNGKDIIQLKDAVPLYGEEYVGQPQLPVVTVNLALPKGQKATSVNISANGSTTLSGNYNIVQVPEPEVLGFVKKERKNKHFRVKHNAAVYPPNFLLDFTNHQYRQYSYVTVQFIPFSYNAQTGSLDLLAQVSISVSTAASAVKSV